MPGSPPWISINHAKTEILFGAICCQISHWYQPVNAPHKSLDPGSRKSGLGSPVNHGFAGKIVR